MNPFVCRLAAVAVLAFAPMAVGTVATPAVGKADCDNGWLWDPVASVCRAPLVGPPLACDNGSWWDPVANVCRPPVVPSPLDCENGWWWDPTVNVCRPPLIPPGP
ncbi:MAG: hypothetical protein JO152_14385 [Mycobacteriaceae bacterium]|nr:hypothetical protein [Mycobacteriaceae bacterium]